MKIVVDAMGGDHAPEAIVEGAVLAAREYETPIILTGLSEQIQTELDKHDPDHTLPIEIVHADEIVYMHDSPGKVLRSKRKSSMKIGLDLVKHGEGAAFVSAGNTGAVLAYSTISQLGYMFLALGDGAWAFWHATEEGLDIHVQGYTAGLFHLMNHA